MKALPFFLLAMCALPARADLSFDIRETRAAHPLLGLSSKTTVIHVVVQGQREAARDNDIVAVTDPVLNFVALIDYRTETFATSSLDQVKRDDDLGFDSIQGGIRRELISTAQPAVWNAFAVKRDVARTTITGGVAPGEITVTSDWIDDIPGFTQIRKAAETGEERYAQQLEAQIQTLMFEHPERFVDGLKIRKDAKGRQGFQVHTLAEYHLAADAPMLEAVGPEYKTRPIVSVETELVNLSPDEADPAIFLVPPGFTQVDFAFLLEERNRRRRE